MKHVTIYSDCRFNYTTREGGYFAALEYNGKIKRISGAIVGENETGNRAIIYGLIEAVKLLKEPCELMILTSTAVRFTQKSRNPDLIAQFKALIAEKGCIFDYAVIPKEEIYRKTLSHRVRQEKTALKTVF
jgi:ribonuclease HI